VGIAVKFLIDKSKEHVARKMTLHPNFVCGQLLTPLTRYANAGVTFAIDNGAFSRFDAKGFASLLGRNEAAKDKCLFVTVPDVVGSGRRTLEVWRRRSSFCQHWPLALVAQDGFEDFDIPWDELDCLFVGGRDPWKESQASLDLVKTAKILGKHVHVGRVNTPRRFDIFASIGADTCDGSGVAMYDHMLQRIADGGDKSGQTSFLASVEEAVAT
jgi:hypothetical protein